MHKDMMVLWVDASVSIDRKVVVGYPFSYHEILLLQETISHKLALTDQEIFMFINY